MAELYAPLIEKDKLPLTVVKPARSYSSLPSGTNKTKARPLSESLLLQIPPGRTAVGLHSVSVTASKAISTLLSPWNMASWEKT